MVRLSCKLLLTLTDRLCVSYIISTRLLHASLYRNTRSVLSLKYNTKNPSLGPLATLLSGKMDFCEISSTSCNIPDWFTKSFIENTLRLGYNDPNLRIANLEVTPVTSPGDNYVSELYRVVIDLVNNDRQRSVIIKCLPTAEYNLKFICDARLFEKEINVYTMTLPAMDAVNLSPRCFFTRDDMLVLEDLTPLGFKMMDRRRGLDLEHCRAAVKVLARLHAKSTSLPASELASRYPETVYHDYDHAQRYIKHSLTSLAGVVERWEPQYQHFAAIIRQLSSTVLDELLALMPRQPPSTDQHLYVLNHGDFWSNNIMFRYDATTTDIEEVRIVDYQMCRYARLSLDLQYFLYTSVREVDQTTAETELLETYHSEFCSCVGHGRLTHKQLHDDMQRTQMFGFVNACMMLPVVLADPDQITPDLANVADKANTFDWHMGTRFRTHFQTILWHFQDKGLFRDRLIQPET